MVWSVHYLRGIAALLVVLYHTRTYLNDVYAEKRLGDLLFEYGYFGVDIFFMISGFVIVSSTQFQPSKISFIVKRFFRIYPLYIVSLALFIIFSQYEIPIQNILKSVAFIHLNYTDSAPFFGYSVNYPSWTLSYEMVFYFIFLISLSISHKYRFFICSIIILFVYTLINHYFGNNSFSSYSSINYAGLYAPILKISSSPMMIEFIIGMFLFYVFSYSKKIPSTIIKNRNVQFLNAVIFASSIVFIISPFEFGHGVFNIGLGCFLLLLSSIIYESSGKLKNSNLLAFLGDISYPLYISHAITIMLFESYLSKISYFNNLFGFSKLVAIIIFSIFLAYVLHKLIELPFVKIGKNILTNKK